MKMPLREHISIFIRALKMVFTMSRAFGLCLVLNAVISAASPYVPIWFSARLLDELVAGADTDKLMLYAALTVGITFALNALKTYIGTAKSYAEDAIYREEGWSYSAKAMEMAYESIEDREVFLLRGRIQKETQTGFNRFYLYHCIDTLTFSVTRIIAGLALSLSFFTLGGIPLWGKLGFCVLFIISAVTTVLINNRTQKMENAYWDSAVDMNVISEKCDNYLNDYSAGMDIRLYGMENHIDGLMTDADKKFYGDRAKLSLKMSLMSIPDEVMFNGIKLVLYLLLISAALSGAVSVGSIAKYVSCVMLVLGSLNTLASIVSLTMANNHYLKRYFSYFDIPNNMYQGTLTVEKRDDTEYFIEFRNVSFRYPGTESFALKNVNLKFRVGQKLAVVGENGSGKTTFIKLLCRLYDPTEGTILLNSVDIRKYDYDEYMSIFSVVFQDFHLFAFTLGQNVASDTNFDRERAETCLRQAGFGERLETMPDGIDSFLYKNISDKGVEISGGEAQKIALARALYKDAPFLVLDEPTAALDPLAEAEVYSRFNEIAGVKTAIYISHRLSSCRFCDDILVFEKGNIVQRGSHSELVSDENGKYSELWNAQAKYYNTES